MLAGSMGGATPRALQRSAQKNWSYSTGQITCLVRIFAALARLSLTFLLHCVLCGAGRPSPLMALAAFLSCCKLPLYNNDSLAASNLPVAHQHAAQRRLCQPLRGALHT
eukprot:1997715-Pyramimonas_sp.AAC.1